MCNFSVTKRELTFFVTGVVIGSFIGYNVACNWNAFPRHLHQMKAIICHQYIGSEVKGLKYIFLFKVMQALLI